MKETGRGMLPISATFQPTFGSWRKFAYLDHVIVMRTGSIAAESKEKLVNNVNFSLTINLLWLFKLYFCNFWNSYIKPNIKRSRQFSPKL